MTDITKITDGRKWRRPCWPKGFWVQADPSSDCFAHSNGNDYPFSPSQLLATDWELYEEEAPEPKPSLTFDEAVKCHKVRIIIPSNFHPLYEETELGRCGGWDRDELTFMDLAERRGWDRDELTFMDLAERRGWRMEEITDAQ